MSIVVHNDTPALLEKVLIGGDLAKLSPAERLQYYDAVCRSVGLNPLTRPFEYIFLQGRLTLYARKDATDQLRRIHNISLTITRQEHVGDLYIVAARATAPDGRTDEDLGVVSTNGLTGTDLANALLKAVTKAKRRVTLSICGLGWLDETEVESAHDARPARVDHETGELIDGRAHDAREVVDVDDRPAQQGAGATSLFASDAQRKEILRLARARGWDDEKAKRELEERYGVTHTKMLTAAQAQHFIDALQREQA